MAKKIEEKVSYGMGIGSLVTSIIGFLMFLMPYIGIFFSITAIVLAVMQRKTAPSGMATAGLVIGIIGVVSNVIWLGFVALALLIVGI